MGRTWRIEYEGALYQLMSRGNDGQHIEDSIIKIG